MEEFAGPNRVESQPPKARILVRKITHASCRTQRQLCAKKLRRKINMELRNSGNEEIKLSGALSKAALFGDSRLQKITVKRQHESHALHVSS
jgi:hypothetical protein